MFYLSYFVYSIALCAIIRNPRGHVDATIDTTSARCNSPRLTEIKCSGISVYFVISAKRSIGDPRTRSSDTLSCLKKSLT